MNRKIHGLMAGLLGATLALGLGACGGESEDEQREGQRGGQRGAQRSTTEVTMQTLAGDWGFVAEDIKAAIIAGAEANLDQIPDASDRETALAQLEQHAEAVAASMSEAVFTLKADGTVTGVSTQPDGSEANATGTWTLDNRNFSMTIRAEDDSDDEEELTGRVLDEDTIEVDFDEFADTEMKLNLRKRS